MNRFAEVDAQLTNTKCLDEWGWMSNSRGQSPCLVTAYLYTPCVAASKANVGALTDPNTWYLRPTGIDGCTCNSVVYSMLEACARCQWGSATNLAMLSWVSATLLGYIGMLIDSDGRESVGLVGKLYPNPIPPGTAIPAWAFQDVTVQDRFNVTVAAKVASEGLPDTTPTATLSIPASTLDSSTTSSTQTSASPSDSAAASPSTTTKSSNVGPIVGGVVGGVLGALLIGALAFYLLRKRQVKTRAAPPTSGKFDGNAEQQPITDSKSPGKAEYGAPMIYDPDDPRTFPTDQPPPSFVSNARSVPTSFGGHNPADGGYSNGSSSAYGSVVYKGVPEV
ncbi:hypothetical protein C8Q74DRAFT_1368319 [Fomes fomentarius]|nr:hypothetical protein C8Q74DRAFT_1368319 [Fomes fomentarius]